jgi:GT2 family glycosyltransferase
VCVVIPTHNRLSYLQQSIASVLNQDYPRLELVVVDDGSSDGTAEWLSSVSDPRLRVVTHPEPRERSAARNAGLHATDSRWVLFLDDDDVLTPGAIRLLSSATERWPDAVAIAGRLVHFDDAGRTWSEPWVRRAWVGDLSVDCVLEPFIGPNRALLRRDVVISAGGWSEDYPPHEDYLLGLLISSSGRCGLIPDVVLKHRHHGGQSDLSAGRERAGQILNEVVSRVSPASGRRLEARFALLQQMAAVRHKDRQLSDIVSLGRAAARDRLVFRTPLTRRTVLPGLLRLIGAVALSVARRGIKRRSA